MDRRGEVQEILLRTISELKHLHYHSCRVGTMPLEESTEITQKLINDLLSTIGYGTGAEPSLSGESIAFQYAMNIPKNTGDENERIVFDIGSHEGEYVNVITKAASGIGYRFKIHCFEPDPTAFHILSRNFISANNVQHYLHNFAISSENNKHGVLYSHILGAAQSSLHKLDYKYLGVNFDNEIEIVIKSLKSYCQSEKIQVIDLLKIDTEGHEFEIISSVMDMIKEKKIRTIQFEFGVCNVHTKVFFKDFYNLLSPYYKFYRIHPEGLIPIPNYKEEFEVFHVVNYLCELI